MLGLRRFVLAPLVVVLTVALWALLPIWLVVAALISPRLPGSWRPLRMLWLLMLHLTAETLILIELLGLWVLSGFGWKLRSPWFERTHYDIAQTYLRVMFREARRVLHLEIATIGPEPDAYPGEPLLVCCRHAGPGDSFTLMYALLHWYSREPRVVLKDTLAWDPAIGTLLHRVPSRFISPHPAVGEDLESHIADLARNLDENDAFVIFPEGGNFTPARRERAISKLDALGFHGMARRAEEMIHVLAPRPGGFLAALDAAPPEADVMLVAHTGLDHMLTMKDVWRELPMDKRLIMRWWRVPRGEIPEGREARIEWLYDWWERIDDWVAEHQPTDLTR